MPLTQSSTAAARRAFVSRRADDLRSLLWPIALVVTCALASYGLARQLPVRQPQYAAYAAVGLLTPALLIACSLLARRNSALNEWAKYGQYALIAVLLVAAARYAIKYASVTLLVIIAVQFAVASIWTSDDHEKRRKLNLAAHVAVAGLLTLCCWIAAANIPWWQTWPKAATGDYTPYTYGVAAVAAILWAYHFYRPGKFAITGRLATSLYVLELIAVTFILGWISLKPFVIDNIYFNIHGGFHHWGVYVGPAQMVRNGGYLLWDVPSQYGFLSELTLAFLPFKSVWMSLYAANALLLTLSGLLVYILVRTLRPGIVSAFFALIVTIATVFMMQGYEASLVGSQCWPSAGAYRFFWAEALLALVYAEYRLADPLKWAPAVYVAGSLLWLVGSLWACESALYCSTIWLPAMALMLYRHSVARRAVTNSFALAGRAAWFALPFALLIAALGLIDAFYVSRLGRPPDWRAFVDYALSFQGGYVQQPFSPLGCIWLPISIAAGLAIVTWHALKPGLHGRAVSVLSAAWTFLWTTTSYFFSNPHPNVMQGQTVLYVMVIMIAVHVSRKIGMRTTARNFLVACLAPVFIMTPSLTIGQHVAIQNWLATTFVRPSTNIDATLPDMAPDMEEFLYGAHVGPYEPIVLLALNAIPVRHFDNPLHLQGTNPAWLPMSPYALVMPLPEDRVEVYVRRYLERHKSGGWLIEPAEGIHLSDMFVYSTVLQYCQPTRSYVFQDLRLTYFQYERRR
ncbi:MAG: hypothetical protein P4L33_03225 [Capsulimonadaceae bacterium]|nr:hypothetical protein [Capsulimonadaceae bacterium]